MHRRLMSILILVLIILNTGFCFGLESGQIPMISDEELIVGEPMTDILYAGKSVFVNVNIIAKSKVNVAEHPVKLSLVKLEDKLPFAEELGKDLSVPIIKLSSSALIKEAPQAINIQCMEPIVPSENGDLKAETKIINQYFANLDQINTLTAEIATANKKYKLEGIKEIELAKSSEEVRKAYAKWVDNKKTLAEIKKGFEQVQATYLRLFEVEVYNDEILKFSYLKEVGKLDVGRYKLRFTDENDVFIKEIVFEIIKEEDSLKTITPAIGVNDNSAK